MRNIYTVKLMKHETMFVNVVADSAEEAEEIVNDAVESGLTVSEFYENEVYTDSIDVEALNKTCGYGVQMLPEEFYPEEDEEAGA